MIWLYLDESGDLGFKLEKEKTSKFFIVTILIVSNKRPVEKIIKKIFSGFSKNEIKRHGGVLHCYKETPTVRKKVLNGTNKLKLDIASIILHKQNVDYSLRDQVQILYNYVTNIILDRLFSIPGLISNHDVTLVAEKRETNKYYNENFIDYLKKEINKQHNININIEILKPHQEKCLQVVDHVCWAIYRKYEHKDVEYYSIISNNIRSEGSLFARK